MTWKNLGKKRQPTPDEKVIVQIVTNTLVEIGADGIASQHLLAALPVPHWEAIQRGPAETAHEWWVKMRNPLRHGWLDGVMRRGEPREDRYGKLGRPYVWYAPENLPVPPPKEAIVNAAPLPEVESGTIPVTGREVAARARLQALANVVYGDDHAPHEHVNAVWDAAHKAVEGFN